MVKDLNCWLQPTNSDTGYGGMVYQIYKSMLNVHGVNLKPLNPTVFIQNFNTVEPWYKGFLTNNFSAARIPVYDNVLSIAYPTQSGFIDGQKSYIYTMFESDNLPKHLVDCINIHSVCIVPCDHNIEIFKNCGVKIPIYKVPLGNDKSKYYFINSRNYYISNENPFTFLHIGATNFRKGHDVAIKAFKKVFGPEKKDVRLVLKVSKQYTSPWLIAGMRTEDPRIVLIKEHLSDKEMLNLYASSHCYVGCSRGDAWNLLAFQALATGMPAITTNYCGPVEYSHLSYPLNYDMKHCKEKLFGEDWGWYGEPNLDHLCALMEYCYKNPDKCRDKGIIAANEIGSKYTWDHTARKVLDVIEATQE